MAIPFRSWRPTKSEADLLIDMLTARLAPAKIAKTLYVDVRTLRNFLRPSLMTSGGPLVAISSPYSRHGELWKALPRPYPTLKASDEDARGSGLIGQIGGLHGDIG
jgi:hypothetical protein